jgi:geranylgeranyl diphosphate synthase, type II
VPSARPMRRPDELRSLVERRLDGLQLSPALGGLEEAVRYALEGGGKRIRPVLCLATAEAAGGDAEEALDAAAAIELIHSFSLVHDDLPALDDDDERRGRPTVHVRFGEAQAILAGDALMAEAFQLANRYSEAGLRREILQATLGMIGGQYLDIDGGRPDRIELNRLKTGRLFEAAVACGVAVAGLREPFEPWRGFAADYGLLYQLVDDVLDDDGIVVERGRAGALSLVAETADSARGHLDRMDADTSVLAELLGELTARVKQSAA